MADKNKKVVNTEEQNKAVNKENSSEEPLLNTNAKNTSESEKEKPDGDSEIERPHRIEGDDADKIERKIPNM